MANDNAYSFAVLMNDKQYDGEPCRVCGGITRYTTSRNCIECAKVRSRQKYDEKRITKS